MKKKITCFQIMKYLGWSVAVISILVAIFYLPHCSYIVTDIGDVGYIDIPLNFRRAMELGGAGVVVALCSGLLDDISTDRVKITKS